jgi:M6 family metalloprotease-like protein
VKSRPTDPTAWLPAGPAPLLLGALVACVFGSLAWAGPAHADAGPCSLSGSGREGATDTSVFQVPDQTLEAAMIFVDFSDHTAVGGETPPNSTIAPALADRATEYMEEVSYGATDLAVEYDTTWQRMSQPSTAYNVATFDGQRAFIQEAIQKADTVGDGFDFAGLQTVIVVAAPGALTGTAAFHGTAAQGISVDGTNVRWGTTVGDDARGVYPQWPEYGSKVLSHELLHTYGLPDLYRSGAPTFETQHVDAGSWDIMGWTGPGMHILGWHRQKLGWLAPPDLVCVNGQATATISPLETPGGTKMMISKTAPGVAYVAEVRAPIGLDDEMCDSGGVLIYKVNADGGNAFGNGIAPITVKPVYPDEPGNPSGNCAALSNAAFELGPGEPSTFTEGPVTVEILSGTPGSAYSVRMTGPDPNPATPTPPTPPKKKCKKGKKLKKGKCVKKKRKKRRRR